MPNQQPPERLVQGDGRTLDLHSMFFTIQGEGPFTGHRSIFVRLAGCNLQCPGCDTEYTEGRREVSAFELVTDVMAEAMANKVGTDGLLVVITGGEPLRQPIGAFVAELLHNGFKVQIESNGMFAPDPSLARILELKWATLVISPKTAKINARAAEKATCFKYVLQASSVDPDDGLPLNALEHVRGGRPFRPLDLRSRKIYLNPYDEKDTVNNAANLTACAESAKRFGYILGVQLHKLAGLE